MAGPNPNVDVIRITDVAHPARRFTPPQYSAFGLAAARDLLPFEPVIEYRGVLKVCYFIRLKQCPSLYLKFTSKQIIIRTPVSILLEF